MTNYIETKVWDIFICSSLSALTSKTFLKNRQQPVSTQKINCLYFYLSDTYTLLQLVRDATTKKKPKFGTFSDAHHYQL
jgi:hypothetical protein